MQYNGSWFGCYSRISIMVSTLCRYMLWVLYIYSCLDWKYAKLIDLLLCPEKKSCCRKKFPLFRSLSVNLSIAQKYFSAFFSSIRKVSASKMLKNKTKDVLQMFHESVMFPLLRKYNFLDIKWSRKEKITSYDPSRFVSSDTYWNSHPTSIGKTVVCHS